MSARYKCPRCNDQQLTTDSASQALCYPCGVARVLVSAVEYYVEGYLAAMRQEGTQQILNRLHEQSLMWKLSQRDLSWDDIDRCRRIDLAFEPPPVGLRAREVITVDWTRIKYQMAFGPVTPAELRDFPPDLQQLPPRHIDPKYHATVDEILRVPSVSSDKETA